MEQNRSGANMAPFSVFKAFPISILSAIAAKVAANKIANMNEVIILITFVAVAVKSVFFGRY